MIAMRRLSLYLAAAAAFLAPIGVALPDGVPGSGRSIVTAVSLGLLSASVVIRGGNGNGSTPT